MPPAATSLQKLSGTIVGHRLAWAIIDRFRASLHDAERIPRSGGALLVGNHTFLGIDAVPFAALLSVCTGRVPRFLGDRNLWRLPGAAIATRAVGVVPGTPDEAVHLLRDGELVCVYPGGVDDSFKLASEAYTLKWGRRSGFARVAMRARVPIVPFAALGIDDLFEIHDREHRIGRRLLGSPRYDLPKARLGRRSPLDYHVLAPIEPGGDPDDPAAVEQVRQRVHDAVEDRLAEYRLQKRSRPG